MAVTILTSLDQRISIDSRQAAIGSGENCTIAFPGDSRLQAEHALLRQVANRWMIEAKHDCLIQVNDQTPARMGWLNPGDVVKLSEQGPELTFEPASFEPASPAPAAVVAESPPVVIELPPKADIDRATEALPRPVPVKKRPRAESPPRTVKVTANDDSAIPGTEIPGVVWAIGGGGLVLAGILVSIIVVWVFSGGETTDDLAAVPPTELEATSQESSADDTVSPTPDTNATSDSALARDANGAPIPYSDCVYLVTVSNPATQEMYQLGTAWAVGERHLVTSAAIAQGIESNRELLPVVEVIQPITPIRKLTVESLRIHPEFERAAAEDRSARNRTEEVRNALEAGDEPGGQQPSPAEIERLTNQVIEAEERRFQATERMAVYDIAVLMVARPLPAHLPRAPAGKAVRPGSRVTLVGVPFVGTEIMVDPEVPTPIGHCPSQILARSPLQNAVRPVHRLLVRCQNDLSETVWSGAPFVNSAGEVVAIYVRPTPPPIEAEQAAAVITHDAVDIGRLGDFASDF